MIGLILIRILESAGALVFVYFILALGATYLLVHPSRLHGGFTPKGYGVPYKAVSLFSLDGRLKIAGWLMRHEDQAARGLVVFSHGLGASKADFLSLATFFFRNNFDCVLFDFRAHGDSEGFLSNLGFEEKNDILGVLEYVDSNHLAPGGKVILIGTSMGAAASLLAAAGSDRISAMISDSAFADGYELIKENFEAHFHGLPRKYFYKFCRFLLEKAGRFPVNPKQPVQASREIRVPVLFIHGEQDEAIPVRHAHQLFEACGSAAKELWVVEGANHVTAFELMPEDYQQKILDFIERRVEGKKEETDPLVGEISRNGVVEAAAGVIVQDGKVLVIQRAKGTHLEGMWEFPGGKLNLGELPQLAVIREVREEVNLEVIVESLISKEDFAYPDRKVRIHFFKCRILKGDPKPLACAGLRWVSREELGRVTLPPANEKVLPQVMELLS